MLSLSFVPEQDTMRVFEKLVQIYTIEIESVIDFWQDTHIRGIRRNHRKIWCNPQPKSKVNEIYTTEVASRNVRGKLF